jgi:MFS family permease
MIDLYKRPWLKYILFGNLYFSEGLIFALTTVIIVLFFTDKDISISTTTLVGGIASIPWMLKFIFGPTIDFFGKYGRKIFIMIGGIIGAISIFIVSIVDPKTSIIPFTVLLFIGHSGVVLVDVTADAWAIQTTKINEKGKVNAAMFTGLFAGHAIGGILLAFIATYYGFGMVFVITGFLICLSLILPIFIKEEKIEIKRKIIRTLLIKEFKKKNTQLITLLTFISGLQFGMLIFIIPEYMTNVLLLNKIQIGLLTAIYPISIVIGTIIGGSISDKYGRKKIIYISLVILLVSTILLTTVDSWEKLAVIYGIVGGLTGASLYSSMGALIMDVTNPKIGGAQYSIIASVANFGELGIATFSGSMVVFLGYNRFFLYTALTVGMSLLVFYFIKETHTKTSN